MKIVGFIWLENIVEKLFSKHSVDVSEVRELFSNKPHFRFIEKGHRKDENIYAAFGRTDEGRYLICFFIYKQSGKALVVSARNMSKAERKLYDRK